MTQMLPVCRARNHLNAGISHALTKIQDATTRHPDRIQVAFDDHRLMANAGLLLPSTLALHLGLPQLVQEHLDLGDAPGWANTGDKMLTGGLCAGWGRLH